MDCNYISAVLYMYAHRECTAGEAMRLCVQEGMTAASSVEFIRGIPLRSTPDGQERAARYIRAMCHVNEYCPRTEAV